MSDLTIGQAFCAQGIRRLDAAFDRIQHCLDQLNDDQIWWRPHESMNSIGNLLLHLCGNLTQWIIAGVRQEPDKRNRPLEFAQRDPVSKEHLLQQFQTVVQGAKKILAELRAPQLLEPRRIQGFDETVLSAIFDSLTHLAGHAQEIVYITRMQLGAKYRFAWVPSTPEEGAPKEAK